jgi:hypothetical protein
MGSAMGNLIVAGSHEMGMMALAGMVCLVVGVVAGRLWQRWRDLRDWRSFSDSFSEEELALVNAHRLRREREGLQDIKARKVQ